MAANKKTLKIAESLQESLPGATAGVEPSNPDANREVGVSAAADDAASGDTEIQEPQIGEPAIIAPDGADLVPASAQVDAGAANSADASGEPPADAPAAPTTHNDSLTDDNSNVGPNGSEDTTAPSATEDGPATDANTGGKGATKHYAVMAPELNAKLKRLAGSEGVTVSTLVRRVLTAFADGQPAAVTGAAKVDAISEALDRVLAQAHEVEATIVRMGVVVVDGDVAAPE